MNAIAEARVPFWRRIAHVVATEARHALPPTLFFIVGFNLIVLSINLVLARYSLHFSGFMLATGGGLIVGKSVLVADKMPWLRRFDTAPLIQPILFKTFVYSVVVFVARLLEAFIHYVIDGGAPAGFPAFMAAQFSWYRFAFIQIWIVVLFLIYTAGSELDKLFGDGELWKILFTRGSTEAKLTRRQRIRTLIDLSHLTDRYPLEVLTNAADPAHDRLVTMIVSLAATRKGHVGR